MREGPKSVILAILKARRSYLTEEMTPFGVVLAPQGVIQTPDPLLGCGLLAISSVIWADMAPQGVIQGSKRGQNGSFWGSQNDPSDRWFWPFSPPKPGQEGSQKGSKKGSKPPLLDPSGTPPRGSRGHLKARRSYFWPFLQSFWPPGALGGSFRGPNMTILGGSFWPSERSRGRTRGGTGG